MFATVSIHQMSSIMQLTPVTGGDQKLSTADETRMTKSLDTISLNFMQALEKLSNCDRAPFVRACYTTFAGFLTIVLTGRTNRGWRRSFSKSWKKNVLRSHIATDDESISTILLTSGESGYHAAIRRAQHSIAIDTKHWGFLLNDVLHEIDSRGKASNFAKVLYMQMVTALRPRHFASMAETDDSTITFVEIAKPQYQVFAASLGETAGLKIKTHAQIVKKFIIIGLTDGGKGAIADRVVAVRKSWLPASISKSKKKAKELCLFLQACSEIGTTIASHENHAGFTQFHLAGQPYGSTRALFKLNVGKLWSKEYTHLTGLVRTPATQFQIAAFVHDLESLAKLKVDVRAKVASKILAHGAECNGWYYIWAVIDGVGTYNWFRGSRPAGAH